MRVVIDTWLAVATWKWKFEKSDDFQCTICLTEFELPCNKCKFGGDDCAPI
jgi:hypothetical protein